MASVECGKGDVVPWGSKVGRRLKRLAVFRGPDIFELLIEDSCKFIAEERRNIGEPGGVQCISTSYQYKGAWKVEVE